MPAQHMPEVIVIDEIGTEAECIAARTIAQRGVQLVATAHGNELQNVLKNPSLADLVSLCGFWSGPGSNSQVSGALIIAYFQAAFVCACRHTVNMKTTLQKSNEHHCV